MFLCYKLHSCHSLCLASSSPFDVVSRHRPSPSSFTDAFYLLPFVFAFGSPHIRSICRCHSPSSKANRRLYGHPFFSFVRAQGCTSPSAPICTLLFACARLVYFQIKDVKADRKADVGSLLYSKPKRATKVDVSLLHEAPCDEYRIH